MSAGMRAAGRRALSATAAPPRNDLPLRYEGFQFEVLRQSSSSGARRTLIETPSGTIQTPAFIFCATKGAIKGGVSPDLLRAEGTSIILSNTYHLMLQPGEDTVQKLGGLQKMTGWNGPMLTDSGGYQIFSMGHGSVSNEVKGKRNAGSMGWSETLLKINETGATFRSYVDGKIHHLSPEKSIQVQQKLGADLIVVLDECTPFHVDKSYTAASMRRSHRWALRSLIEFRRLGCASSSRSGTGSAKTQALYGIIQGGVYEDLRQESAEFVNRYPFFGIAIGGSLGSNKKSMHDIVSFTRPLVRNDRPVHLLGIGGLRDIFHGVRLGIDTFDCVHPTRLGRHGGALVKAAYWEELFTEISLRCNFEQNQTTGGDVYESTEADSTLGIKKKKSHKDRKIENYNRRLQKQRHIQLKAERVVREHINITKSTMAGDPRPIEPSCNCHTCRNFSRGYIHHLLKSKEMLGQALLTSHNIHFMNELMKDIRIGIDTDTLDEVEKTYIHPQLGCTDVDTQ